MARCYKKHTDTISQSPYSPCRSTSSDTDFVSCCWTGNGHECMSNGFCKYPELVSGGSQYYHAHCTDPDFKDSSCYAYCPTFDHDDVVFNTTSNTWQCCGSNADGSLACDKPSGVSFDAPPKNQLYELAIKPTSASTFSALPSSQIAAESSSAAAALSTLSRSTSTSTATLVTSSPSLAGATTSAASSPTATVLDAGQSGPSPGVIAGVVVAVVVGVALIAGLVFFLLRRKRRQGLADRDHPDPTPSQGYVQQVPPAYVETSKQPFPVKPQFHQATSMSEMPASERPFELPGH